jgi:O-antigen ligase
MFDRLQPRFDAGRLAGRATTMQASLGLAAVALVNVVVAVTVSRSGSQAFVLVLGAIAVVPIVWVAVERPDWILYTALLVIMLGGVPTMFNPSATPRLLGGPGGTGGTNVSAEDLFVLLAIGSAVLRLLIRRRGDERPRFGTIVLSWPLVLLATALMQGVIRGHDHYGTSYISQPVRIFAYAAIGLAFVETPPDRLLRNLTRVFYLTIAVSTLQAGYYLATGTSQTDTSALSTGGTRVLALSTAMYLAAGLVLALVHLDLNPQSERRRLHIWMAILAALGIVVSLGRTTFAAVAILVPVLVVVLRRLRRTMLTYFPVAVAVAMLVAVFVIIVSPSTASTIGHRFTGNVGTDTAVIQRQRKYKATMQGFDQNPVFGFGFGRPVTFVSIDQTVQTFSGDPENSYIYVLAGGGIVALASLLTLVGLFFIDCGRRFLRSERAPRAVVTLGASLAFILLVNAASGPVLSNPPLMLLTWIGLLLPAVATRQRTDARSS